MLVPCLSKQNHAGGTFNKSIRCRHPCEVTIEQIADFDNLYKAFQNTIRGKSSKRAVRIFRHHFAYILEDLQNKLLTGSYVPKPPFEFDIFCKSGQKTRHICSPRLRDSIVMHAIYQLIYYHFDRKLIKDTYGCRIGGGSIRSSDRVQAFMRDSPPESYYLQLDIRKYYYSIDHRILRETLSRDLTDPRVVELIMSCTNSADGVGLCVGYMLSQFLGLVYLSRLDHYCKRVLKLKHYVRYVDDVAIVGISKEEANFLKRHLEFYVKTYFNLEFSKVKVHPLRHGINFTGFRTWRTYRLVRKRVLKRFNRALRTGKVEVVQSYLAIAEHTATMKHFIQKLQNHPLRSLLCKRFKNYELQIHSRHDPGPHRHH